MIDLIREFFLAGLFAFGGGLAAVPFLQSMADRFTWFSQKELIDMIAVSESTPGPIGLNMATFAGLKASGMLGGILASLSMVAASVVLVMLIVPVLTKYRQSRLVNDLFYGIRPVSAGLIAGSLLSLMQVSYSENLFFGLLFSAVCFLVIRRFPRLHPGLILGLSFLIGALFSI